MSAKKLLDGKTVVVTGCASGIGLETARLCKAWGATVLGVSEGTIAWRMSEVKKRLRAMAAEEAK